MPRVVGEGSAEVRRSGPSGDVRDERDEAVKLRVPFKAPSASLVRRELRAWLAEKGFEGETVEDARVVISELVGNSVRHAAPLPLNDLVVSWHVDENDLVISVSDGGSPSSRPEVLGASEDAICGRGLSIVDALTKRWWVEGDRGKTTVHVRIPI